MENFSLVPSTSIAPTSMSIMPSTSFIPATSNVTITLKREKRNPVVVILLTTLAIGIALVLAGVFGPKLIEKGKRLIQERKYAKPPPVIVPPQTPLWLHRHPSILYPVDFFQRVTLKDELPNHRSTHPYFRVLDGAQSYEHLILTATAAANQAAQSSPFFNVCACHYLGKLTDHCQRKPHAVMASRFLVDLMADVIELEGFQAAGNTEGFHYVWSEITSLLEDLEDLLKEEKKKLKELEKNSRGELEEELEADLKDISSLIDLVDNNKDILLHNLTIKHRDLVHPAGKSMKKYDKKLFKPKGLLSTTFAEICSYVK